MGIATQNKASQKCIFSTLLEKGRCCKAVEGRGQGNARGKRDYAILLLVVRLGLRAGDIRNLQLSNLDWNRKKIIIIQSKNKKILELPILNDVGWALIDYLKNGRPRTRTTTVFVKQKPPYSEFKDKDCMQYILRKYMRLADLEIPKNEHCGLILSEARSQERCWEAGPLYLSSQKSLDMKASIPPAFTLE